MPSLSRSPSRRAGSSPGSPGGKALPSPPAVVRQDSSSSSSSSSASTPTSSSGASTPTVRVSSPLNPHTSPHRATVTPPALPSPGSSPPRVAAVRSRPPSFDAMRRPSPLALPATLADDIPVARVRSNPLPGPSTSLSSQVLTPDALTPRGFMSSLRARSLSRDPSPDARTIVGDDGEYRLKHDDEGEDGGERPVFAPVVSWWQVHTRGRQPRPWAETPQPQRKRTIPVEQSEGYRLTRQHVARAVASVLHTSKLVAHEALFTGVDLLRLAPVPMLEVAGMTLLNIWDALESVEMNRLACLRLTERCAQILLSVREEIMDAPRHVAEELQIPVKRLEDAYTQVHILLQKQAHRPFLKRYLKRDEIQRSIQFCDAELSDALNMFGMSIQIRTLKLIQKNEIRRQREANVILDGLNLTSFPSDGGPPSPASPSSPLTPTKDEAEIARELTRLRREQNARDRTRDLADLRQLMRAALQTNDDAAMIEVLQIGRDEMPEAIKTLQRALDREMERERASASGADDDSASSGSTAAGGEHFRPRGRPRAVTISVGQLGAQQTISAAAAPVATVSDDSETRRPSNADTLDREFIEGGIEALRRLSQGTDIAVPSWTITRYEVDLEAKIGIGFFSDVYRAHWREHVVAVKVLAETTPKAMFVREMGIWKTLEHPNVLELLGASSATGEPPWFFVSPYYKNGSLVKYLKGLDPGAPVDMLKMMNQVARGMAYLHNKGVLHGDLKAANVLVDDGLHCVISDFGQSEMKSEVVRLSGAAPSRGTLRWQAPELMRGDVAELTPEADVYAFAILCVEVLGRGSVPWPLADNDAVRHFVLDEDRRPNLPLTPLANGAFHAVLQAAWSRDPRARPSFAKISRDLKTLREKTGAASDSPRTRPMSVILEEEAHRFQHASPDMRPADLPETQDDIYVHASSSDGTYLTAESEPSYSAATTPIASRRSTLRDEGDFADLSGSVRSIMSLESSASANSSALDDSVLVSGYLSPPDPASNATAIMNERRYRLLLQHEYHTTLTLPLWTPSPVRLGAVGYLSKPEGRFVTLLNCFDGLPGDSGMYFPAFPALPKKNKTEVFSARNEKRSAAQRGLDMLRSLWGGSSGGDRGSRSNITRTHAYQLRAGHRVAHLYAESTIYRYIDDLSLPKEWFEANIDQILSVFGADHKLTREDAFLIIGTLEAQDYGMFVSHQHSDGQMNFNVFAGAKPGEPWGEFLPTTATLPAASSVAGPQYDDETLGNSTMLWANKVSSVHTDGKWDAVLLARLRFRTDAAEPTRL